MKHYELTCLISPNLSDTELKSLQEKIIAIVQKEQGVLVTGNQDKPVKKRLAYPIKKTTQAHLITFTFQLNPESLENFERKIIADEKVLRCTILAKKLPKLTKVPEKPIKIAKRISPPKVELKEIEKKLEEILGE